MSMSFVWGLPKKYIYLTKGANNERKSNVPEKPGAAIFHALASIGWPSV